MRWQVASIVLLLAGGAAAGQPLVGLSRPLQDVSDAGRLLPRFDAVSLPGHVVGILQWDPNSEPRGRVILTAQGCVCNNLFLSDPGQPPAEFPIDAQGGQLHLSHGVRGMLPADVTQSLPAVVDVTINQGRGASQQSAVLVSLKPHAVNVDVAGLANACEADFQRAGTAYGGTAPHQDLVYEFMDDRGLNVTILRKDTNHVVHTGRVPHPWIMVMGQRTAVARYRITLPNRLTDKAAAHIQR